MYISIGTIIFIAIIVYILYSMRKENEKWDKKHEKEEHDREIQRQIQLHEEKMRKEKEENDIAFIADSLNIDHLNAKEVYSFLMRERKLETFHYSESKKRRLEFYNKFLQEKKELEKFRKLIEPIINEEQLDLDIENLFFDYQHELFTVHSDIPLREKLKQFNSDYNSNKLLLVEILKPMFQDFEYSRYVSIEKKSNFYIKDRLEILFEDVYKIIEVFNDYFDLSIKNINEINLSNFYFFEKTYIYEEWNYILEEIFIICLFESHFLPENTKLENIRDYEYKSAFNFYCRKLFFYKPYYQIVDCKNILSTHIEDLINEQKKY